jgi:hypothetical protein
VSGRDKVFVKKDFIRLMKAKRFRFSKEDLRAVPVQQGVYVIFSGNNIVHVGRTYRGKAGLRHRLKNHLHGSSSFTLEYLKGDGKKLKRRSYTFRYVALPQSSWRRCALLESYATGYLCPAHIGKHHRRNAPQSK